MTAAKKYIEEMYKSQAQALRDRRKRRSLLEQELKQQTTQVRQRYILYILRERERERKQKGFPVVVVLGNGGLDTSYTWTRSPLPPPNPNPNVLKV